MEGLPHIHLNLDYAYTVLFLVLGMFSFFTNMKLEDKKWEGYHKSRKILGSAFFLMTAYCILRSFHPQYLDNYGDFWLLTVVSLLFSWLNYTSFLYLINAEYQLRRRFLIDGSVPLLLMFIGGLLGMFWPSLQETMRVLLGLFFITKSVRMFYVCDKEWRKMNAEQEENYDEAPDIKWMRVLVWLTFILGLCTLIALYVPAVHSIYCFIAPLVFVFMVFKLINYLPVKIVGMRGALADNVAEDTSAQPKATSKATDLETKIAPYVEKWVEKKLYCNPNLSIKEVATQMGTNHNYLSQYLNNTLQVTFQLWLNALRIEEAKSILLSEPLSVEEVGIRVGIPESYNFSRWFKNITGTTPLKYRKTGNQDRFES